MFPVSLFNVAQYLTDSLRGPVLKTLTTVSAKRKFDGLDEMDGWDGLTVK